MFSKLKNIAKSGGELGAKIRDLFNDDIKSKKFLEESFNKLRKTHSEKTAKQELQESFKRKVDYTDTILHHSVKKGFYQTCKYLIEDLNLDVNIKDNYGNTPLYYVGNHVQITKLLTDKGAKVTIYNDNGETPLDFVKKSLQNILNNNATKFQGKNIKAHEEVIKIFTSKENEPSKEPQEKFEEINKDKSNTQNIPVDTKNNSFQEDDSGYSSQEEPKEMGGEGLATNKQNVLKESIYKEGQIISQVSIQDDSIETESNLLIDKIEKRKNTKLFALNDKTLKSYLEERMNFLKFQHTEEKAKQILREVYYPEQVDLMPLLCFAVREGFYETCKYLIENIGVDINKQSSFQSTALHLAVNNIDSRVLTLDNLPLPYSNKTAETNQNICIDLDLNRYIEIARLLIENDANTEIENENKEKPFDILYENLEEEESSTIKNEITINT